MSKDGKKPVNITINEGQESKTDNVYENYIIQMNQKLKEENDSLREEVAELTSNNTDLEEDLDKEEKSKTYMKGLMHNLYDMKKKSFEIRDIYKKIHQNMNTLIDEKNNNELKIRIIPKISFYLTLKEYYILSFIISPFLAFVSIFYEYDLFLIIYLFFLSIYPGTILYLQIKEDILKTKSKYDEFISFYKSHNENILKITKDIKETEDSCKCLDTYIDEL